MDIKPVGQAKQTSRPVAAEVRKMYLGTGKITPKHGPIGNLGMDAMTMTFTVKDKASLQCSKEGQAIWAVFDTVDGQSTMVNLRSK